MAGINVSKTNSGVCISKNKGKYPTAEMTGRVEEFFSLLLVDSNDFTNAESEKTFNKIYEYIKKYDRILYSPISNLCYQCFIEFEADKQVDIFGSLVSNIEKVSGFSGTLAYKKRLEKAERDGDEEEVRLLKDTTKAIVKIWDHVNLAQNQYNVLSQTDDEYRKKFDELMSPVQSEISNEMRTSMTELSRSMSEQLLSLVSIFTALAFLLFGGISSLENIFSGIQTVSMLKLVILGCIWGLCLVNLIFVFLFCISKMTKLSFSSSNKESASIFQKYPIFWWTNYIIITIFIVTALLYFFVINDMFIWLEGICIKIPETVCLITGGVLFLLIVQVGNVLKNACKSDK
ncbi:hypothetical protein D7V86_21145 [bacterium D16-51]|nr:hypothetical protein D7V96_17390 [bacterium D16-59]RKI55655.1 hypothetical protein D7V86_21145 [bacterium D16-51]